MTTVTDCPLRGLVTVTRDPNGRVRCAAVWLPGLNVWPLAVRRPEAYQVATTCRPAHLPSGRTWEKKPRKTAARELADRRDVWAGRFRGYCSHIAESGEHQEREDEDG
jgi:hypothetical protein